MSEPAAMVADRTVTELRLRVADLERQLNRHVTEIQRTLRAYERDEDLSRRMRALAGLTAVRAYWTTDLVLDKIREWVALYGEPPTAMEWNPAQARARDREDVVEQFAAGDWPHASTVQKVCGSWNKAITAAGFEPLTAADGAAHRVRDHRRHSGEWPEWNGWELFRYVRERADMTQADVATRAALSVAWVQQVETGMMTNPQVRALLAFARAVGVPPSALVSGTTGADT